ncbi:MAG: hypothetical protein ACOY16_11245, partial [Chloroflexota bacterium]
MTAWKGRPTLLPIGQAFQPVNLLSDLPSDGMERPSNIPARWTGFLACQPTGFLACQLAFSP